MVRQRIEEAVAGLVCFGFPAPELDPHARTLLSRGAAGVILFARNFRDRAQVQSLCAQVRACSPRNLMIAVDHEGGRVQRFRGAGFSEIPPMREIGAGGDPARAREVGATIARELREVGINVDFAPVLDVDSNPANPVIGERSFGRDPALVATMGAAFIEGLQAGGVAACGKHFPGHGDTDLDSHLDLPRLSHSMDRLDEVELPPFDAAIAAGVSSIMTAHVVFEALDPGVPATMSRRVISELLRESMGFEGVTVSDDLEMKAIADRMEPGEAAVAAILAGVDLLLCCHEATSQDRVITALADAVESRRISVERVQASRARIARMMSRFSGRCGAAAGCGL